MAESNESSPISRSKKLASARAELTRNQATTQSLELTLRQLKGSTTILVPRNVADAHKSLDAVNRIVTKSLPKDEIHSPDLLSGVSEVFFVLGEELSPFYGSFAKWADTFRSKDKPTQFTFQGRDSLGFMVAFTQMYGGQDTRYSPVTRNTHNFYGLNSSDARTQLAKLKEDYLIHDLINKKQIFVDFGFKGSNPRKELLLATSIFGKTPDANILLGYYDEYAFDSIGTDFIWNNFPRDTRDYYKAANEGLKANTAGFLNSHFPEFAKQMEEDPYFREVFQELSSYIRESPDATKDAAIRGSDQVVLPVYELAAKYSFLRGLMSSYHTGVATDQGAVKDSLDSFSKLYTTYPDLFRGFKDFSTKYIYDASYKETIDSLNKELGQATLTPYRG